MLVQFYIKHPAMVGLDGPFDTEDAAWAYLLKGPSTLADRNVMREEGWVVRTGLITHKSCGCGWCYITDEPERAHSVPESVSAEPWKPVTMYD